MNFRLATLFILAGSLVGCLDHQGFVINSSATKSNSPTFVDGTGAGAPCAE